MKKGVQLGQQMRWQPVAGLSLCATLALQLDEALPRLRERSKITHRQAVHLRSQLSKRRQQLAPLPFIQRGPHLGQGFARQLGHHQKGPAIPFAAGHAERCQAFFSGYGVQPDAAARQALLRLLLLHRYSNLPAQITMPQW